MERTAYPVVIIGAGPVGLAAAAHVQARGLTPLVLERGSQVGASVAQWGHVRFFSPWKYSIDTAARALLEKTEWTAPEPDTFPTGNDLVDSYMTPLSQTVELRDHIRLNTDVISVTRDGFDKMKTPGRDDAPFLVSMRTADGHESGVLAQAVIDASGTWTRPNPLGASGRQAIGESALQQQIAYGIPDVLTKSRLRYAGKRVLVVGSGHSAFNVLLDLVDLADQEPGTAITWAIRAAGSKTRNLFGGGINDALPARGALGARVQSLVADGRLKLVTGLKISKLEATATGIVVSGQDSVLDPVDEIIAAAGFRPDMEMLSELRLALDPAVESPSMLAPMIDPNLHSCGSVPPHGAEELRHPEPDVYIVGMKSYGRAPTFLMLTGYEQVRSVAAAIAGDWDAARDVQLVLPETGVCSSKILDERGVACCGPAVQPVTLDASESACCGGATGEAESATCCTPTAPHVIQLSTITRGSCC